MLLIRSFINLLVVPVIAFWIYYMKSNKELKADFEGLLRYAIMIACNIPMTRFFTFVFRKMSGMSVEADSSYYTLFALISAALLPVVNDFGKKLYSMLLQDKEDNDR